MKYNCTFYIQDDDDFFESKDLPFVPQKGMKIEMRRWNEIVFYKVKSVTYSFETEDFGIELKGY